MTETKPTKEEENIEKINLELNDIDKYEMEEAEKEKFKETKKKLEEKIPKGKKLCPICSKLIGDKGYNNHLIRCEKDLEEREQRAKFQIQNKLPPTSNSQETKDSKEMQRITNEITQKQKQGITFTPEQINAYNQAMIPLIERKQLADEFVTENLQTQIQKTKTKREEEDDYAPSWKEIDKNERRKRMYSGDNKSGGNNEFIALMNSQTQANQQMFQMMIQQQKDSHAEAMATQKANFDYMIKMGEKKEKEENVFNKIKEMKDSAEMIGLKEKDGSDSSKTMDALGKLAEIGVPIFQALQEKKMKQQSQTPIPAQIMEDENPPTLDSHTEGENSIGNIPYSLPSPSGSPTIAPPHLSDQEVEQYAKQNYVEQPPESSSNTYTDYTNYTPEQNE